MRKQKTILEAEHRFCDLVWYERKLVMREKIQCGEEDMPPREIMQGMLLSMTKMQRERPDDLGPYTEFEWGMINGKLSALRWVMGEDWDELYT